MKDSARSDHEGVEGPEVVAATVGVEELFRAHASFAASLVQRLGVPERDVPDIVQEVFLLAHRKGGFVPGPAKPRTWIAAIAVRMAAQYRRRRREALDPSAVGAAEAPASTPEELAAHHQSMERVERCLATLDEEHRVVFVLYEIAGDGCAEIAAALEVPVGTVYSRLHYARRRFAEEHARTRDAGVR